MYPLIMPYFKVGDRVKLPSGKIGFIEKITTENKYKNLKMRLRVRFGPAVRNKVLIYPHLVELIEQAQDK